MHQSSGNIRRQLRNHNDTHTQCRGRRFDGEKCSNSFIYINCGQIAPPPTDSQLQHYDCDIIMSSGGNRPPFWTLPKGSSSPRWTL